MLEGRCVIMHGKTLGLYTDTEIEAIDVTDPLNPITVGSCVTIVCLILTPRLY